MTSGGNCGRIGGLDYLQSLVNCVLSAANWRAHEETFRSKYQQRGKLGYQGESEKGFGALEPKFSHLLKAAEREGNTVTPMIRLAWENTGPHALARTPARFCWGKKQL